jgi:hypothetical protein
MLRQATWLDSATGRTWLKTIVPLARYTQKLENFRTGDNDDFTELLGVKFMASKI